VIEINCHGRLLTPAARSSAWRQFPDLFPAYYDDAQMFCGGVQTLWGKNGGKCGICGEDYSGVKQFEKGGSMYTGNIVAKYTQGQQIDAVVEITANHYGYFEFRLCNVDGKAGDATQSCLDQTLLKDVNGNTKIFITRGKTGKFTTRLNLPSGFSCNHCVFQWKYNAQNSWGTDKITGQSCVGCGNQEQFFGCSDISIKSKKSLKREELDDSNEEEAIKLLDQIINFHVRSLERLYEQKREYESIQEVSNRQFEEDNPLKTIQPLYQFGKESNVWYKNKSKKEYLESYAMEK